MSNLLRLVLKPLRHPLPWLLVQVILVFLSLRAGGLLETEKVPDTTSYRLQAEARTVRQVLSSYRTYGYPMFLKAIGLKADGRIEGSHARYSYRVFRKIPTVHAVVFLASIFVFWWSVRVYTGSPWLAFAMATPLPYAAIWALVRRVQPDFLGAALALVTVSLLILVATRPRVLTWGGMTVALFLTYQVRPAYLFLVALLPVFGPLLRWVAGSESRRRLSRFALRLLAATLLPLLLFCSVRWLVVRDFGLVSFGGYNAIGVAASFLDREVVKSLDRNKALARTILRQRQEREMEPMPLGGDTLLWQSQHNPNVWNIAVPEALDRARALQRRRRPWEPRPRGLHIEANQTLSELSVDVFGRRPLHYMQWVRDNLLHCLNRALADNWVKWLAILIALSVPLVLLAGAGPGLLSPEPHDLERRRRLLALVALGLGFFLAHALIVLLVDVPYDRFVYAMILLLPSVLAGVLFEIWRPATEG